MNDFVFWFRAKEPWTKIELAGRQKSLEQKVTSIETPESKTDS